MFTHLHLHTEFSLLDGLTRITPLMDRVAELGQEAVAITDHGAMYGAIDFYREARKHGIKPIIGVEGYIAPGSRLTREVGDKQPFHLTMLARNKTGYNNLLKLVTSSHLEGYYYRPRMDRELMAEHGEGIIVLSGCPSGELHRLILDGRMDEARATINWYREVFDEYYLEIQDHDLPEFHDARRQIVQLSREMGVPLVATNDSHYLNLQDHDSHDTLLCIGTNSTVMEEKRMKMSDPSYYVRSEAEMREAPALAELQDAIDNTWKIAEKCDLELEFGRLHMPEPELPPGVGTHEFLEQLCWEGLRRRLPNIGPDGDDRLRYELEVVKATGFSNYMHIVREIATFARGQGMRIGVRGSAAASLILYTLGVTDIDPLKANLVFERFLNLERPEAPDVDFDIPDERRDEVLRFVANRYGSDRVAQIITFGTLGAKAAVRDVGRALGMGYADVDRVARLIPNALHMTLDRAMSENGELKQVYDADAQVRTLVDSARKLEGVARNASTHAAGVVISREPLVEHLPLARSKGEGQAMPTTQYPMENVAAIGLVKMDLLGLSNLTILEHAVELINQRHGIQVDLENLEDGDATTFEMLSSGETFGAFQLESAGMRRAVQELKPNSVDDLAALVALYRPGPMQHIGTFCRAKHGLEPIAYPHPDLADILDQTYGVIVFQDQVLKIAQKFAGYTLGAADIMRKAMGKKIAAMMLAERERFISGAIAKGYSQSDAEKVFELIEPFAGYAFNKAHSYSYGTIAYQTAWLKANYPVEYLTAVLMQAPSHPAGALERIAQAYTECVRIGIKVLVPDVNKSESNFSIEDFEDGTAGIRFGLSMIKNCGAGAAEAIVEARQAAGGSFASLNEFCKELNTRNVNKRAVECLIKAGAMDSIAGRPEARGAMLINLDRIMSIAQSSQKLRETGQTTMFDLFAEEVAAPLAGIDLEAPPVPLSEVLAWEKELLGVWLSEHPFTRAASHLANYTTALCNEFTPELLDELPSQGRDFVIAGTVGSTRKLATRDGRSFIAAEITDLSGTIEVTVWPDTYDRTPDVWSTGRIVLLLARVRERGDRLSFGVNEAVIYEGEDFVPPHWINISETPAPTGRRNSNGRGNGSSNGNARASETQPPKAVEAAPAHEAVSINVDAPSPPAEESWQPGPTVAYIPNAEPAPTAIADDSGSYDAGRALEPVSAPIASEPGPPFALTMDESPDVSADERRLALVFELLQKNPGPDAVLMTIRTLDGASISLALPSTTLTERLRGQLLEAVGGAVAVPA